MPVRTGWPGVSILRLSEVASLISNSISVWQLCYSLSRSVPETLSCCWDVTLSKQATTKAPCCLQVLTLTIGGICSTCLRVSALRTERMMDPCCGWTTFPGYPQSVVTLCVVVLFCTVLCCTALCCNVLCCTVLCCTVQFHTEHYCTVLYCT